MLKQIKLRSWHLRNFQMQKVEPRRDVSRERDGGAEFCLQRSNVKCLGLERPGPLLPLSSTQPRQEITPITRYSSRPSPGHTRDRNQHQAKLLTSEFIKLREKS